MEASTYIGSTQTDNVYALDLDNADNVYITGSTTSSTFPTTGGAYDQTFNFNTDIFVTRLDNDLTTVSASTFLGGSAFDVAYDIGITPTTPQKVLVTGRSHQTIQPLAALSTAPWADHRMRSSPNSTSTSPHWKHPPTLEGPAQLVAQTVNVAWRSIPTRLATYT